MTQPAFRLPREHGGWTMWGAAIVAGAAHAAGHGAPSRLVGMLAAGLLLMYSAGDWAQSGIAELRGLPFRGRSDPRSLTGAVLLLAGFILVVSSAAWTLPGFVLTATFVPAIAAIHMRGERTPFDRQLLAVSSLSLSAPAFLFGAMAAPGCLRCALAFWSLPAAGFPLLTLLISTRLPAPPATVKRLGWLAAAMTVVLATGWVMAFWPARPSVGG